MGASHLLAIDQGTTSTRAIVFDAEGRPRATSQEELPQSFPRPGWVEHDPEDIWRAVRATCRAAVRSAGLQPADLAGVGLTNQRETIVLWERATGRPLHPAIVWQDRRTADRCEQLVREGCLPLVRQRTGLLLDPYFSATKLAWMLDQLPGARERARAGELAAGTIDAFLVWRLTGGAVHATDATNASRTLLFDIHRQCWDDDLLELFDVPRELLPEVKDCAELYGTLTADLLGAELPLGGVAGDQQAAAIGQACWEAGRLKSTYGTGCFALLNTGADAVPSQHRLLTTVAWRYDGRVSYALEGSIFSAGATVQWLRDGLGLLASAEESEAMAARSDSSRRVHLVPAFTGLGAPHWDAHARGALVGLTRDVTADDVVRAGLEAVAFQTADLLDAMIADGAEAPTDLRVDGGMVANDWLMQFLADIVGVSVARPRVTETTALGAAWLAGLTSGLIDSPAALDARWALDRRFEPAMSDDERAELRAGWRSAVGQVLRTAGTPP